MILCLPVSGAMSLLCNILNPIPQAGTLSGGRDIIVSLVMPLGCTLARSLQLQCTDIVPEMMRGGECKTTPTNKPADKQKQSKTKQTNSHKTTTTKPLTIQDERVCTHAIVLISLEPECALSLSLTHSLSLSLSLSLTHSLSPLKTQTTLF